MAIMVVFAAGLLAVGATGCGEKSHAVSDKTPPPASQSANGDGAKKDMSPMQVASL
jgi:hypothetical protein